MSQNLQFDEHNVKECLLCKAEQGSTKRILESIEDMQCGALTKVALKLLILEREVDRYQRRLSMTIPVNKSGLKNEILNKCLHQIRISLKKKQTRDTLRKLTLALEYVQAEVLNAVSLPCTAEQREPHPCSSADYATFEELKRINRMKILPFYQMLAGSKLHSTIRGWGITSASSIESLLLTKSEALKDSDSRKSMVIITKSSEHTFKLPEAVPRTTPQKKCANRNTFAVHEPTTPLQETLPVRKIPPEVKQKMEFLLFKTGAPSIYDSLQPTKESDTAFNFHQGKTSLNEHLKPKVSTMIDEAIHSQSFTSSTSKSSLFAQSKSTLASPPERSRSSDSVCTIKESKARPKTADTLKSTPSLVDHDQLDSPSWPSTISAVCEALRSASESYLTQQMIYGRAN